LKIILEIIFEFKFENLSAEVCHKRQKVTEVFFVGFGTLSILTIINFVNKNFSQLSVVFVEIDETVKNNRLFLSLSFPVNGGFKY
jgi:hypothetical protein